MFVIVKPNGSYWSGFSGDSLLDAVHYADPDQAMQTLRNLARNGIDPSGYQIIFDPLPWSERLTAYRQRLRACGF